MIMNCKENTCTRGVSTKSVFLGCNLNSVQNFFKQTHLYLLNFVYFNGLGTLNNILHQMLRYVLLLGSYCCGTFFSLRQTSPNKIWEITEQVVKVFGSCSE